MRTEVKIGLVVCILVTGVVVVYLARSNSDSETETSQTPAEQPGTVTNPPLPAAGRSSRLPTATTNTPQRVVTRSLPPVTTDAKLPTSRPAAVNPGPTVERTAAIGATPSGQARLASGRALPTPNTPTMRIYTVKAGDTGGFYGIAKRPEVYGDSRYGYLIRKANPTVDSRRLRPGQKLNIPPLPVNTASIGPKLPSTDTTTLLPSGDRQYIIAEGDNFSKLAERYYGHVKYVDLIIKANPGIDSTSLKIGQKIVVPRLVGASPLTGRAGATARGPAPGPGQKVYTIRDGDLLSTIAQTEYGASSLWPAIAKVNPGLNPDRLPVGKTILLPGKAEAEKIVGRTATTSGGSSAGSTRTASSAGSSAGYVEGKPYFGD